MRKTKLKNLILLGFLSLPFLPKMALALNPWGEDVDMSELDLGTTDIRTVISQVINIIMGFLGVIAIIIILLGGFKWMTAGGNEEKVAEAKKLMISGVIGLVIVLAAYGIALFVVTALTNATGANVS